MNSVKVNSQFAVGFVSAFLLLAGFALLSQAVAWFQMNPQPQAFIEFLNTPLFSILDIFTGLIGLLLLFVLITAPAWAPRP
jgi:hypothetical protein